MNKTVKKKVYYREAKLTDCEEGVTLQSLLDDALSKTVVKAREEKLNEEEAIFRVLNQVTHYRGMTFCQMLLVDPGACQPVMIYVDDDSEYKIESVATSELSREELRKNSDFVNSMLYFGVKGNEIVIMPSQALPVKTLELHLTWLLGEKAKLLSDTASFGLIKKTYGKLEKLINEYPVKSIEIGSPVVSSDVVSPSDVYVESDRINVGIEAIKAFVGKAFCDSWLNNITEEANLQARIIISYNRKTDECGRELMNKLGTTLRNIDDSEVRLTLQGYGVITGDELNVSKTLTLEMTDRGLYVTSDLYGQMANWLIDLHKEIE